MGSRWTLRTDTSMPHHFTRVVITNVRPRVDAGARAAKAIAGDPLSVEADVFADGHDALRCEVRYRHESSSKWSSVSMSALGNDRWRANIPIEELGDYQFMIRACVDRFGTWRRDVDARLAARQDVSEEFLVGARLLQEVAVRAKSKDRRWMSDLVEQLAKGPASLDESVSETVASQIGCSTLRDALSSARLSHLTGLADPEFCTTSPTYPVKADPPLARFGAWYEMFPRSAAPAPLRHGTLSDVIDRLDYVSAMGFDVLYLPPIHPIGRSGRKGPNGSTTSREGDPGSPWAIGSPEGGHTAIHPELGTLEDFDRLVAAAQSRGIEVALDLAFQASPDHPWVAEHPDWFTRLPSGAIRHAENPPKRYEDIFPLRFDGPDWKSLWLELLGVVDFWIAHGVTVFRVDNPHTKPFAFWEWLITSVKARCPRAIFLSEAFTRPRVMEELAKLGFTQSYTYFSWRTTKWEIESYFSELAGAMSDYFRPNLWPNTPDILTKELQTGGRAAFVSRLVLAATLGASYGVYGPPFELQEHLPRTIDSEEYLLSEKYEIRTWDLLDSRSLAPFVREINAIRRAHPALQFNDSLHFHAVDNQQIIAYSKDRTTDAGRDLILVVVNLDHHYEQSGWVNLDFAALGVDELSSFEVRDLLTGARYTWGGSRNFVKLNPHSVPCHLFSLVLDGGSASGH